MELLINKLGPIQNAKLELDDITVLIGPPNVGKSYSLKALYANLLMLDLTTRNSLLESIFNELDILKYKRIPDEEIIFNILTSLAIIYKINPQKVENIIKHIKNILDIGQVNIEIKNNAIIVTSKRKEDVDIKTLNDSIKKKINLLWSILPTTDETQVILKPALPEFLPILRDSTKKPITIRWKDYDRHLKLHLVYQISMSQEKGSKLIFEKTTEILLDIDSPIIKKVPKSLSRKMLYKLEETKNKRNLLNILVDFAFIRSPYLMEMFLELEDNIDRAISQFAENIGEIFEKIYKRSFGIQSTLFIPFGRSPLVYQLEYSSREPFFRQKVIENCYGFDILFRSYLSKLSSGRGRLSEGNYDKEIVHLFEPVLQGNLIFDERLEELKYKRWGFEELYKNQEYEGVSIKWASALANEITGVLLPILAIPRNSFIIVEEPESQLHYSAQVLMALTFIGLSKIFNHKIAFSTHSDVFAITLAYIQELKPSKDKVIELIKKLLEMQGIDVEDSNLEPLAKAVSENTDIDIKFYYYEPKPSGVEVLERKAPDILMDVPGITDVMNILATWAMRL